MAGPLLENLVAVEIRKGLGWSGARAELSGRRFHRGICLYTGAEPLPFGTGRSGVPFAALREMGVERS